MFDFHKIKFQDNIFIFLYVLLLPLNLKKKLHDNSKADKITCPKQVQKIVSLHHNSYYYWLNFNCISGQHSLLDTQARTLFVTYIVTHQEIRRTQNIRMYNIYQGLIISLTFDQVCLFSLKISPLVSIFFPDSQIIKVVDFFRENK